MPLILVRSDTASPEFSKAKEMAAPALAKARQLTDQARQLTEQAESRRIIQGQEEEAYERKTLAFRRSIREGDDTTMGIVVNPPNLRNGSIESPWGRPRMS